jgi:hypothetical protein
MLIKYTEEVSLGIDKLFPFINLLERLIKDEYK